MAVAVLLEIFVLYKAMKEVLHETHVEAKGLAIVGKSFSSLKRAKPATKLVFMEDLVATLGGIIAIIGILFPILQVFMLQKELLLSLLV